MTRTIQARQLAAEDIGAEVEFLQAGWSVSAQIGALRKNPGSVALSPTGMEWSWRALLPHQDVTVLHEAPTRTEQKGHDA